MAVLTHTDVFSMQFITSPLVFENVRYVTIDIDSESIEFEFSLLLYKNWAFLTHFYDCEKPLFIGMCIGDLVVRDLDGQIGFWRCVVREYVIRSYRHHSERGPFWKYIRLSIE